MSNTCSLNEVLDAANLRKILDYMPSAVFQLRRNRDLSVVFEFANAAFAAWHGLAPGVCTMNAVRAAVHPDDLHRFDETVLRAAQMGEGLDLTYRVMVDGKIRWLNAVATAQIVSEGVDIWTGTCSDVTVLKRTETTLVAEEAKFRVLFDSAITGKWVHRHFKPLAVNGALALLLGFSSPEELMAQADVRDFMLDELRASTEHAWVGLLQHNAKFYRRRMQMRSRMGRLIWVDVVSSLIDWDGAPAMHDSIINITAEMDKEHELILAREDAELALMSKSQFLATISHELRTPMNGIVAMTDVLGMTSLSDGQRECVHLLYESGQHMMDLVDNILDFDRLDAQRLTLVPAPVDLMDVLEDRLAHWRPRAKAKRLCLLSEWSMQSDRCVIADAGVVSRVLDHMLSNAIKFTETGQIELRAYSIHPAPDETAVRIEVADSGCGLMGDIDDDQVFEAFHRPHDGIHTSHSGLGLGLAICRKIMDLMGGRIGVISHPNQGSTFWIECTFKRPHAAIEWDQSRVA
jgi:PAS domain S-box-containing protein